MMEIYAIWNSGPFGFLNFFLLSIGDNSFLAAFYSVLLERQRVWNRISHKPFQQIQCFTSGTDFFSISTMRQQPWLQSRLMDTAIHHAGIKSLTYTTF